MPDISIPGSPITANYQLLKLRNMPGFKQILKEQIKPFLRGDVRMLPYYRYYNGLANTEILLATLRSVAKLCH
jgi:hypothetical protein